jgi:parallel beta-helix repeat protein
MSSRGVVAIRLVFCVVFAITIHAAALQAATIVVNDSSDTLHSLGCAMSGMGTCSLRDAVTFANANPGSDVIHFAIPGSGVHTITLESDLPLGGETIDGYSQPGSSPNTNGPGQGDNAVLKIEINGNGKECFRFPDVIRGLVINRCGGSAIRGGVVEGNFIGVDVTGAIALPNGMGASGGVIGGTAPASRNLISGNLGTGVFGGGAASGSWIVQGNFIGTDATGKVAVPNGGSGIEFYGFFDATMAILNNLISANRGTGIVLYDGSGSTVQGNLIGTDVSGSLPLGNGSTGVLIDNSTSQISSTVSGNTIAFNGGSDPVGGGVVDFLSKYGYFANPKIVGNSIFANTSDGSLPGTGLGIDLEYPGPNGNRLCNAPGEAELTQNSPALASALTNGSEIRIRGTLNTGGLAHWGNHIWRVEFFSSTSCDPSGFGEGQTFLGSTDVTVDEFCNANYDVTLPVSVPIGRYATATATDLTTSEFSPCIQIEPLEAVDSLVKLTPVTTAYNAIPVLGGPAGTYSIKAMFTNASPNVILNPVFEVKELSGGNLLLNADGGPGGVGAKLTPNVGTDHLLSPGESFSVEFVIGLQAKKPFTFFVNLLGFSKPL